MKTKHKVILFAGAALLAGALAFGSVVGGGVVTVAATDPHLAPVQWVLQTTMQSSVQHHAADIVVPSGVDLLDPALAQRAFGHYSVACTPCHGAPGVDPAPWLVLNPPALPLVETADRWSDAELYWIVKHGIKMTGMPALGPTHGEDDLWAIAAFVRQLPEMTAEGYQAMASSHGEQGHAGHASMAPVAAVDPPVDVGEIIGSCPPPDVEAFEAEPQAPTPTAPVTRAPARATGKAVKHRPSPPAPAAPAPAAPAPTDLGPTQHRGHRHAHG